MRQVNKVDMRFHESLPFCSCWEEIGVFKLFRNLFKIFANWQVLWADLLAFTTLDAVACLAVPCCREISVIDMVARKAASRAHDVVVDCETLWDRDLLRAAVRAVFAGSARHGRQFDDFLGNLHQEGVFVLADGPDLTDEH